MNLRQDTRPEHAFYCADGRVLHNLRELTEALKGMSQEAYRHHASESRNDFHNWIRDVYGNKALAKRIASAKSSAEAAQVIGKAISPTVQHKKKTAERIKAIAVKRKPTKRMRKPARKTKKAAITKTAAAAFSARKKEGKKKAVKIKKKRKAKRKPAKRKIKLQKTIHLHLKRIARQFGFL